MLLDGFPPALALAFLALAAAAAAAPAPCDDGACPAEDSVRLMQLESGVRAQRLNLERGGLTAQKLLVGVPVYNYHLAYPSSPRPSALELAAGLVWNIELPQAYSDAQVRAFCDGVHGAHCTLVGHPEEGGIAFVAVRATEAQLEELLSLHPGATAVEPDLPVEAIPEVKPDESLLQVMSSTTPWGLDRIDDADGLDQSYTISDGGAGVHVYVMDTGVRTSHSDFEGRAIPTIESVGSGITVCNASDTTCALDFHGHGTHCAGTIAGKTYGVAKKAIIHAVTVSPGGKGRSTWTIAGMDWVASNGPRPAVISMSLGGPASVSYQYAVTAVVNSGITVVVAAGNEGSDACLKAPAFVPAAITVGATGLSYSLNPRDEMASFSNFGTCVDVWAPGVNIVSAGHKSDDEEAKMSGTSMACPHVAGVAALVLALGPERSPEQVYAIIMSGSGKDKVHNLPMSKPSPNYMLSARLEDIPSNVTLTTTTTTTTAETLVPFLVVEGPCTTNANGSCVQSSNYPQNYDQPEACTIAVSEAFWNGKNIEVDAFETEKWYDVLRINGLDFSGDNIYETTPTESITWSADFSGDKSGWKLCAPGAGSSPRRRAPAPPSQGIHRRRRASRRRAHRRRVR